MRALFVDDELEFLELMQKRLVRRGMEVATAPDGQTVDLSATDRMLMECFLQAQGETVSRDHIRSLLGHTSAADSDNSLHATIYRLRRRIERATPVAVPLQSQQKVGYQFRAPLIAA